MSSNYDGMSLIIFIFFILLVCGGVSCLAIPKIIHYYNKKHCQHSIKEIEVARPIVLELHNGEYRYLLHLKCKCCKQEFQLAYSSFEFPRLKVR